MRISNKNEEYNHGLRYSEILERNIIPIYDRVNKKNKAGLIVIDGGVGEGKTTLATEIADGINKQHGLGEISLEPKDCPQLALGGVEFVKKLRVCYKRKLPVIIYDEAGDFNRRGALTRFNAMINRVFETFRAFKIIVILCLPSSSVLDNDLYDKQIPRLLLNCYGRTNEQGNFRGYSLGRMMYIRDKMKKLVIKPYAYQIVEPNFYGHFKDLSVERSRYLDILSTKGKIKELEKTEVKMEGLLSIQELANRIGVTHITIRKYIKELKLKPSKIFNRKKFFHEDLIDVLSDIHDAQYNKRRESIKEGVRKAKERGTLKIEADGEEVEL